MSYRVKDIVCDYGVYEDNELVYICNCKSNAVLIASILAKDKKGFRYSQRDFEEIDSIESLVGEYTIE